jgi:hypothetical protein
MAFERTKPSPGVARVEPLDAVTTRQDLGNAPIPPRDVPDATCALLTDVGDLLNDHIYFGRSGTADYLSAWVLSTYVVNAHRQAPYIAIMSASPQAGKSVLLDLLAALCRYGLGVSAGSGAALSRALAQRPYRTLLIDEFDRKMAGGDRVDENLIETVNAGIYATGVRMVSKPDGSSDQLPLFGPKALAGIDNGRWEPAIVDRCVVIRAERMPRDQNRQRLNLAKLGPRLDALRHDLGRWERAAVGSIADRASTEPAGLEFLSHRLAEGVVLPIVVADLAGQAWGQRVRGALRALQDGRPAQAEDHRVRLVRDLALAWDEVQEQGIAATSKLCDWLNGEENLPYGGWGGRDGLTPLALLRILQGFAPGLKSKPRRINGVQFRSLIETDLTPLWERYGRTEADRDHQ